MHPVTQVDNADQERDPLLPLHVALAFLPRRPSPPTLWRWRVRGVNGVKLRCVRCGHQWMTRRSFVEEFLRAQTAASDKRRVALKDAPTARSAEKACDLREAGLMDSTAT